MTRQSLYEKHYSSGNSKANFFSALSEFEKELKEIIIKPIQEMIDNPKVDEYVKMTLLAVIKLINGKTIE